jgi:hypothetical protein
VRHTRFQVLTTSPLCAPRHHPLSRSRWLLGGAAARGGEHWRGLPLSGDGGCAPGEAKQRPRPYFVSAADGCYCRDLGRLTGLVCQVCKLRQQQQQQHPQRPVPPRVLRRLPLPQRQRLLPVAPPPKQPLPPSPHQHAQSLWRSNRVRQRTPTPASTQYSYTPACQQQLRQWSSRRRRAVRRRWV